MKHFTTLLAVILFLTSCMKTNLQNPGAVNYNCTIKKGHDRMPFGSAVWCFREDSVGIKDTVFSFIGEPDNTFLHVGNIEFLRQDSTGETSVIRHLQAADGSYLPETLTFYGDIRDRYYFEIKSINYRLP